ncbi:MAG TPA: imidazole glycerol phosphate synthase subunit HisH [Paludibacteraceae bacterium]|jgi:glutamine amidotransferase|nr:imidazole glycerol phosphate synthase subunit HisH [Paludibacteraceae bacterium]
MDVAVIKYNAGNIRSVLFALERLQVNPIVTDEEDKLRSADKVIFPGVGEASSAMAYLKDKKLDKVIPSLIQPVLGICLGMQLMCSFSEENNTPCLGIFKETVKHFPQNSYKVPQIGWNNIYDLSNTLFSGIAENSYVYFIHGFYVEVSKYTIAKANYMLEYSAALHKNNFYAVQFHPEKSGEIGQKILENFLFQV